MAIYINRQQQPVRTQPRSSNINPLQAFKMYQKFAPEGSWGTGNEGWLNSILGGGSGLGGSASVAAGGSAGSGGAATLSPVAAGGSGGNGLWSGVGSLASNPWVWLAAAIAGNELYANHRGYRDDDTLSWIKDIFTGEVMHQDIEKRFLPDIGIEEGSDLNKWISVLVQPISADLSESWDRLKSLFD